MQMTRQNDGSMTAGAAYAPPIKVKVSIQEIEGGMVYVPAVKVAARYGVSLMTIHRWLNDPEMAFPVPVYFGRNRFWPIADLVAWEASQPCGRTRERATAKATDAATLPSAAA